MQKPGQTRMCSVRSNAKYHNLFEGKKNDLSEAGLFALLN